jgi:hypothetical protein
MADPMKVDTGAGTIDVPAGYAPTAFLFLGKEDSMPAMSAGPTVAKTKTPKYKRTLGFNFAKVDAAAVPADALAKGLNDVKERARAQVVAVADMTLDGQPAKAAELRHVFDQMGVVTFVLLSFGGGTIRSVMLTVLDSPKVVAEAKLEFDKIVAGFKS